MAIARAAGGMGAIRDATGVLMDPATGLRGVNDADQIAAFEWGAARASRAVYRIVHGVRLGMSVHDAAALMDYQGEPLTCRMMLSSSKGAIIGLRSPSGDMIEEGAAITAAVGYRGGLTARAGLVSDVEPDFFHKIVAPYFMAQVTWCEMAAIGRPGGEIEAAVKEALAKAGLRSAFTPGHLGGHDEWLHSTTAPGSATGWRSGALVQCDIIPAPMPAGRALNCEDALVLADETLRAEIAVKHPELMERFLARQKFMREVLGIGISDDYLPLSDWPHCLPPFWLRPGAILIRT